MTTYANFFISAIGSDLYIKNLSYHSVFFDDLFDDGRDEWTLVHDLVSKGIENRTVQPLDRVVFKRLRYIFMFY